ncbi:14513_t:CDS:2 [Ambispora leptoticha]|uniref:Probable RNA-binding protein 18 n=1 Tax=Ambispora leptoticha TaxID=144679 RepID=A0A9N9CLS6_9GLOM|nr:14513_t:CDS:2 [Ambispora leptoticha]
MTSTRSNTTSSKLDEKRLYIGNLDPSIDEYTVVKLFEPYGKITHLDYLFHKSGPRRGQPRGYCFLEYSRKEEALKAMNAMHSKVIKHRSMIVTFAYAAPDNYETGNNSYFKKRGSASILNNRPTTISLLKTHKMVNVSTDSKIQALERKLAQMKQQQPSQSSANSSSVSRPSFSSTKLEEKSKKANPSSLLSTISQDIVSDAAGNKQQSKLNREQRRFSPYELSKEKK